MRRADDPLGDEFFSRGPQFVARQLLGRLLVSMIGGELTSGIIVETESYLAKGDSACHASRGRTPKTTVMFGSGGFAYVYPIHAKYCFNIVTEIASRPSAVLIRAIEPVDGIEIMQLRRRVDALGELARGPGRLCQALGIGREHNGLDLRLGRGVWIESVRQRAFTTKQIRATERIGVTSAQELKLRFVVVGSSFASGPKHSR